MIIRTSINTDIGINVGIVQVNDEINQDQYYFLGDAIKTLLEESNAKNIIIEFVNVAKINKQIVDIIASAIKGLRHFKNSLGIVCDKEDIIFALNYHIHSALYFTGRTVEDVLQIMSPKPEETFVETSLGEIQDMYGIDYRHSIPLFQYSLSFNFNPDDPHKFEMCNINLAHEKISFFDENSFERNSISFLNLYKSGKPLLLTTVLRSLRLSPGESRTPTADLYAIATSSSVTDTLSSVTLRIYLEDNEGKHSILTLPINLEKRKKNHEPFRFSCILSEDESTIRIFHNLKFAHALLLSVIRIDREKGTLRVTDIDKSGRELSDLSPEIEFGKITRTVSNQKISFPILNIGKQAQSTLAKAMSMINRSLSEAHLAIYIESSNERVRSGKRSSYVTVNRLFVGKRHMFRVDPIFTLNLSRGDGNKIVRSDTPNGYRPEYDQPPQGFV